MLDVTDVIKMGALNARTSHIMAENGWAEVSVEGTNFEQDFMVIQT